LRGSEFEHFGSYLQAGAIIMFQDTSLVHQVEPRDVRKLMADGLLTGVILPSPRGMAICQYRSDKSCIG
jgi:hypothetical protein